MPKTNYSLFLNGSGNLGVGVDSPVSKLHVVNSSAESIFARFQSTGSVAAFIGFSGTGSATTYDVAAGSPGANIFAIRTSDLERLRIDSNGNVGIGTTSPQSKLHVLGNNATANVQLSANYSSSENNNNIGLKIQVAGYGSSGSWPTFGFAPDYNNGNLNLLYETVGNTYQFSGSATKVLSVTQAGNLGLGVTPVVYGANNRVFQIDGGANASEIRLTNTTTGTSASNGALLQMSGNDWYIWNVENSFISFGTNNTEKARITSGGDVGIGTTSPASRLTIVTADGAAPSNATDKNALRLRSTATAGVGVGPSIIFEGQTNNSTGNYAFAAIQGFKDSATADNYIGALAFYTQNSGGNTVLTERVRITGGGDVGIGTTVAINRINVVGPSGVIGSFRSETTTAGAAAGIGLYATQSAGDNWYGSEIRSINTAANPNYLNPRLGFFTQDIDTYLPAGRTEKVSILGNGRVGIGTTAPGAKLEVNGSIHSSWGAYRIGTFYDNSYRQGMYFNVDSRILQIFSTSNDSNGDIAFSTRQGAGASDGDYGTERMRIAASGNVGIGTTGPGGKLTVSTSNIGFELTPNNASAENGTLIEHYNRTSAVYVPHRNIASYHRFDASGTEAMRITTSATVSIGTTTANFNGQGLPLVVGSGSGNTGMTIYSGTTGYGTIQFADTAGTGADSYRGVVSYKHGDEFMYFSTNAAEKMRITSGGNVLVGMTSQSFSEKMSINGLLRSTDFQVGAGPGYNNYGRLYHDDVNLTISTNRSSNAGHIILSPYGNVGIGNTSPSEKLQVDGFILNRSKLGFTQSSDIVKNGLTFYVDFNNKNCWDPVVDGTPSSTSVKDLSNNKYSLSFAGNATIAAKDGNYGLYSNGTGAYMAVGSYILSALPHTWEAWVLADAFSGYDTFWDSGSTERPLFGALSGNPIFYPDGAVTSVALSTGKWYHFVVAVASNNTYKFYMNGREISSATYSGTIRTGTFDMWLGGDGGIESWNGYIPIARMYNRQLSAIEVMQNYNAEKWRFDNNSTFYHDVATGVIGIGPGQNSQPAYTLTSVYTGAANHTFTFAGQSTGTNDDILFNLSRGGGAYGSFGVTFNGTSRFLIGGASLNNGGNITLNPVTNTIISSGNVGIGMTSPQKKLDVNGGGNAFAASFGGAFSAGQWSGIHFGYSESSLNNDLYKKSGLIFERTDNHNQGGNASGKIHFLLNNSSNTSATLAAGAVVTIDSDSNGTVGSVRMGVGTTAPISQLHIATAGRPFTSVANKTDGDMVGLVMTANTNQNTMNGVWFSSGVDHAGTHWSGIAGSRSNYVSDWSTHLAFYTHGPELSNITTTTERMRVTGNGNVGIANTSPRSKLTVTGPVSVGEGNKLSFIGLDINSGGTPSFIKITTTIPSVSTSADFTVNIKGFRYSGQDTTDLKICWHWYNNTFYNATISSSGSWAPTVRLSAEGGFVAIVLTSPEYWPKLYVESMYSSAYNDAYTTGWTWSDADANGSPIVTLVYKSNFGNSIVANSTGLGVGTVSPSSKVGVYPSDGQGVALQDSSNNARAIFFIDNGNSVFKAGIKTSNYWLDLDASGAAQNAIRFFTGTGTIGTGTERMRITSTGNIGIGDTSPIYPVTIRKKPSSGEESRMLVIGNTESGGTLMFLGTSTTTGGYSKIQSITTEGNSYGNLILNSDGGNVGIGLTAPGYKLEVNGTAAATTFNTTSDLRRKENIETISNSVDIVNKLRGVRFTWRDTKEASLGVIAQEVETILPELVQTGTNDEKTVSYGNIVGVLIEAIKEQQQVIASQNERIARLEQLILQK